MPHSTELLKPHRKCFMTDKRQLETHSKQQPRYICHFAVTI